MTGSEAESRLRGEQLGEKMWGRQRRARELLGDRFFVNTTNFPPALLLLPILSRSPVSREQKNLIYGSSQTIAISDVVL